MGAVGRLAVGGGELRTEAGDRDLRMGRQPRQKGCELVLPDAQPRHAGIDLDVHGHACPPRAGGASERFQIGGRGEHRRQAGLEDRAVGATVLAEQRDDGQLDALSPQRECARERSDDQPRDDLVALQRTGHLHEAMAIGVGFEHRQHTLRGSYQRLHVPSVGDDGG